MVDLPELALDSELSTRRMIMPGRLSDGSIAGKHLSGADQHSCRATLWGSNLGQTIWRTAGVRFATSRTSCGDTNGSTLHVAKQVRGILTPELQAST